MVNVVSVRINPRFIEDYRNLGDRRKVGGKLEKTPFPLQKDVFMMAVALGFTNNKEKPLPPKSHDLFRSTTFEDQDMAVLRALFIAKNNMSIDNELENDDIIIKQAERWAEQGFKYLKAQTIRESLQDNIYCVVDMINEASSKKV